MDLNGITRGQKGKGKAKETESIGSEKQMRGIFSEQNGRLIQKLHEAARKGDLATVERLLKLDFDMRADSKDNDGQTLLSLAASNGHETVVRLLVEREDVKADSKDHNGRSPLHFAAENGHEAVVRLLIGREDVYADTKDTWDQTPLSWAASNGHKTVV